MKRKEVCPAGAVSRAVTLRVLDSRLDAARRPGCVFRRKTLPPHPSDTLPVFSQERVQTPSAQHCQPVGIGHSSSRVETDIAEIDRDSHGQVIPHKASWYDAALMDMRMPETDGLNAQLAKPSSLRRPVRHAEADAVQASQRRPERPIGLKGRGAHPFSAPAAATPPLRPRLRADDKLQAFV